MIAVNVIFIQQT